MQSDMSRQEIMNKNERELQQVKIVKKKNDLKANKTTGKRQQGKKEFYLNLKLYSLQSNGYIFFLFSIRKKIYQIIVVFLGLLALNFDSNGRQKFYFKLHK